MMSGSARRAFIAVGFLVAVAVAGAFVWRYGYIQALGQLSRQASSDLALASDRLTGQLQRYRELAVLTADHPTIMRALQDGPTGPVNDLLLEIADKTAALDLQLIDVNGRQIAGAAGTMIRGDLRGAPHISRALQGALGLGHGLLPETAQRVYRYAAPVFGPDGAVAGVVVVIADMGGVEWDWVGSNPAVFFTDDEGIVFVTNRSELIFWRRPEGQPGLVPPGGLPKPFDSYDLMHHEIWQMGWGPYLPASALHLVRPLPVIGLTGEVLVDVAPARRLASLQTAAFAALCLAFGALLFLATIRRQTLAEANAQLEARVAERTGALSAANLRMLNEIYEREEAQKALARAQADLVEAGKLSALGQMSAGISHELNQPLMAIRSFAENGVAFLKKDNPERTAENLDRISDMARRMGRIIKNLRAFARQEAEPAVRVDVAQVLSSAIELAGVRIRQEGVTLDYEPPGGPIWVRGGEVRLGQVFVNLISNALDAMAGQEQRRLTVAITQGDAITIEFSDTGPGIDMPDKVFEPFYSTKEVGASEGLGLGLSISYGIVQSFGGAIKGYNGDQGAVFAVSLQPWEQSEAA